MFIYKIIEEVQDKDKLIKREQYWLDFYESYLPSNGYNRSKTAFGSGIPCSEYVKQRVREANLGNSYHLGMTVSDEGRQRMSDSAVTRRLKPLMNFRKKCDDGYRSPYFGSKFNHCTIIAPYTPDKLSRSSTLYLLCKCDCGAEKTVLIRTILENKSKECNKCSSKHNKLHLNFKK